MDGAAPNRFVQMVVTLIAVVWSMYIVVGLGGGWYIYCSVDAYAMGAPSFVQAV